MDHRQGKRRCFVDSDESPALMEALDRVTHHHVCHTNDQVTRYYNREHPEHKMPVLILVITDPKAIKAAAEATNPFLQTPLEL